LTASDIREGPAFRPVDRHGSLGERRLSDRAVALIVKRHMLALGQASRTYAGHSLRRGMATTAAKGSASERSHHAHHGPHLHPDRARLHRAGGPLQ